MKLLITGGFGYLGGRLAQFLASRGGHDVVVGSRTPIGPPAWLPQAQFAQTQWSSLPGLEQICTGIDAVVHLAGMNARDCASDPVGALDFNATATARLVAAAVRQRVKRFLYVSTAHVYGSPLSGTITEETCPISLHPYAASHRAGEDVVRAAHQRGEIEGIVLRLSNAFGAPAHKDANCWMLLVNDLCRQGVTSQYLVLESSGTQRRDFISLTDACRTIEHLLELRADKLGNGVFNAGGGWSPTTSEMAERVASRVFSATHRRPEILCKAGPHNVEHASLDYRIDKLIATGVSVGGAEIVDSEIDRLIHFCIRHFPL